MKIKVISKKVIITNEKGKENVFYRYFSPCNIQVLKTDEDGKEIDCGIQEKMIEVHFTKTAMKKLDDEKVFAIIESSKSEDISLPFVYKVTTDEDGKLRFPEIWVRDFEKITPIPYTPKQSTCSPILDEEETESVEIVE